MKRLSLAIAAIALVALAGAQERSPGERHAAELIAGKIAERQVELAAPPIRQIRLGAIPIVLEQTRLGEFQARYGGQVRASGEASSATEWLCYRVATSAHGPPMLVWLVSDSEMSSGEQTITTVALELPAARPPEVCTALPGDASPDIGLPGLGADLPLMTELFGAGTPDAEGLVTYAFTGKAADGGDAGQILTYRFEARRAVAIVIDQETTY